jgi:hypothetical protein
MRQGLALVLVTLAALVSGCAPEQSFSTNCWMQQFGFQTPIGPDVVQIEMVLLERPLNDRYINSDLWQLADEQVVSLESRALLEENGFRVGQLGGLTPAGLQAMLTSRQSGSDPRLLFARAGRSQTLPLGPPRSQCRFQVQQSGRPEEVSLAQATSSLELVPGITGDGRVRLRFTPQIEYGDSRLEMHPAEDESSLLVQQEKPRRSFPHLAWEVVLGPNQYLLVGTRMDRPEALGHQCFFRPDETRPVQRLLVLRAGCLVPPAPFSAAAGSAGRPPSQPPLALQAAYMAP